MKKWLLPLIIIVASCSKSKEPEPPVIIDSPTLDLKYDQTHQFALKKGSEDIFASTFKWSTVDTLIGKIDANGKFIARKIGKTTVSGIDGKSNVACNITISPYSTFLTEPILEFGAVRDLIKSKEKRTFMGDTDNLSIFKGENSFIRNVIYLFENGRLSSTMVLLTNTSSTVTEATTFYKERYPKHGVIEERAVLLPDKGKGNYGILMGVDASLGYYAMYSEFDNSLRTKAGSINETIAAFKKLNKH